MMTPRVFLAMIFAYVLPGGGHFFLGRRARAAGFFVIIVFLFVFGLLIDGTLYTFMDAHGSLLRILASLGSMGSGVMYFLAAANGPYGDVHVSTFEYGTTFTLTAGLMNLLLVLDCYDIATERKE